MLAQSEFTTTHHLLSLGVFAAVVIAMVVAGRANDRVTRRIGAAIGFGVWLLSAVFYTLPANLEPDKSLPIQACDLLVLLAPLTLLRPSRLLHAAVYFGGFGLTTQGFVTPTSDIGGPDNTKFWIFWLLHGMIVATAIYIVVVDRFKPTLTDLRNAVLFWGCYALAMIALNYGTHLGGLNEGQGWYYGYLGPSLPDAVAGSILRHLGEWPMRPVLMMMLALTIFALLYLPWPVIAWVQRRVQTMLAKVSADQKSP
ncbi:MAG: TIGR02206 family membrane protein [Phycisphaeraceae bacterium]|nr:TIGR02206 family membrane protein [Phycisphaeraceae bacterium]